MKPRFFSNAASFRRWLAENHKVKREILVGFYKIKTGKAALTWSESVDQALCYGWIDGVRKSLDDTRYSIRFTPRKENSIWSLINIKKMQLLSAKGLVKPAGREIFERRRKERSKIYSHENDTRKLEDVLARKFKANGDAWRFFISQAPSYQKVALHWITSAKRPDTRNGRLEKLIDASQNKKRLQ
ncbi:MAG TPA: YdeI/OmpD-associated family protein [Chryseolinea sp.]